MKVDDIVQYIEELFPLENALDYDNPGLIVGYKDDVVSNVLLALDCTSEVVKHAIESDCNMIITHHPLIFGGITTVTTDTSVGRIVCDLIRNGISLYACHTQLDMTEEFGNIELAKAICGKNIMHLKFADIGVVFDLDKEYLLSDYSKEVVKGLNSSSFTTLASGSKLIRKVFAQGGSFSEENLDALFVSDVDLVVTGEMKHHITVLLEEYGISTILVGHNASERVFLPKLKKMLDDKFDDVSFFVDFGNENTIL